MSVIKRKRYRNCYRSEQDASQYVFFQCCVSGNGVVSARPRTRVKVLVFYPGVEVVLITTRTW